MNRPQKQRQPDGLVNRTMQDILNHLEWSRFEQSTPAALKTFSGNGNRNDMRGGNKVGEDIGKWQFWPTAIAMGTLVGKQFNQVSSNLAGSRLKLN